MKIYENKEISFENLENGDVKLFLDDLPCCGDSDTIVSYEYPNSIECPLCGKELEIIFEGEQNE